MLLPMALQTAGMAFAKFISRWMSPARMVITARPPGRRNDVVVEGELTNFVSLGHREDDTPNGSWLARRHGLAELRVVA